MAIEFLKADADRQFVRPKNRKYPIGLTQSGVGRNSIDYLVVAGGGGGGNSDSANYSGGGGGAGGLLQGSGLLYFAIFIGFKKGRFLGRPGG